MKATALWAAKRCAAGLAAVAVVVGLSACGGPDITQARLEDAVGPTFARLYSYQQTLLGRGSDADAQASASCHRLDKTAANSGAGDDWVCQVQLQLAGPASSFTYEVEVKANGCYVADGPPAVVGGRTTLTPQGNYVVNPLFAIDGCFDIT